MRRYSPILLILVVLGFPNGCSDDPGPADPPANPLDQVSLSTNSITSLGKVYLIGLPTEKAELGILLLLDAADPVPLLLEEDEIGVYLRAPLHPTQPNIGGTVQLKMTSGTLEGPVMPLDVLALPPAPGAYQRVVETLRAHIDQRALLAGTSFAALQGQAFDSFSSEILMLKIAQSYVDDNGQGNDLLSVVANADAYLTTDERELLDRIFGYAPLDEVLQGEIDDLAQLGPAPAPALVKEQTARFCLSVGPEITSAQELSQAMLFGTMADLANNSDGRAGKILDALGATVAVGAKIPGYGKLFKSAGMVLVAWETSTQFLAGVNPSRLVSLSFAIDRTEFPEDETGFAQWSQVIVLASSDGWVADKFLAKQAMKAFKNVLKADMEKEVKDVFTLADLSVSKFAGPFSDFISDEPGGVVEFCARDWAVDITDLPYSTGGVLNRKFTVDPGTRQVLPLEVGSDILRVAAQSSQFAGREVHADVNLVTHPIIIDVTPDVIMVTTPGEVVNLTATIRNAEIKTLLWTAEQGSWDDGIGDDTNGPRTRPLKTPTNPQAYPYLVTVASTSSGGIRASGVPPRVDIATIRYQPGEITVLPNGICIPKGTTKEFTAVVTGLANTDVTWSASVGSFNGNTYSAPNANISEVFITATSVENNAITGMATVEVGDCNCHWSAVVTGAVNRTWDGVFGTWTDSFFTFITLAIDGEGGEPAFAFGGDSIMGTVGTYQVTGSGIPEPGAPMYSSGEDMVLVIHSINDTVMEGTLTGDMSTPLTEAPWEKIISVNIEFRAQHNTRGEACGPGAR